MRNRAHNYMLYIHLHSTSITHAYGEGKITMSRWNIVTITCRNKKHLCYYWNYDTLKLVMLMQHVYVYKYLRLNANYIYNIT